jgi:hypothetical protein
MVSPRLPRLISSILFESSIASLARSLDEKFQFRLNNSKENEDTHLLVLINGAQNGFLETLSNLLFNRIHA